MTAPQAPASNHPVRRFANRLDDHAEAGAVALRRDLWRLRRDLPTNLASVLVDYARTSAPVTVSRCIGDGEGNVVDVVAWIGPKGREVCVRLPLRCFVAHTPTDAAVAADPRA